MHGDVISASARSFEITATVIQPTLYGTATIDGVPASEGSLFIEARGSRCVSQITDGGRFELPYLAPGTYRATISANGVSCSTGVEIPRIQAMRTDLGTISCRTPKPHAAIP